MGMMQIGKSLRLAESAAEAALIVGLVLLPTGWHALDARLGVVLAGMQVLLTMAGYALHAVTFDYLRLTGSHRRQPAQNSDLPGAAFVTQARDAAVVGGGPARPGWPFSYTHREG